MAKAGLRIHTSPVPGGGTEDWAVESLDYSYVIPRQEFEENSERAVGHMREMMARRVIEHMLDTGAIEVQSEYDYARQEYMVTSRVKYLRKQE